MSAETTPEAASDALPDHAALRDFAEKLDRAHMKKIAGFHFALVFGALTLWGAAVTWSQATGSALAGVAAFANALIAGTVTASTLHEWGHFAGARLSGAPSPVLDAPRDYFFMFDFKMADADLRQFTWMSWGGIAVPWILVFLSLFFVPVGNTSGAALVAMLVNKAVAASAFEIPIVQRANETGDHQTAFGEGVGEGLSSSQRTGLIVGAVVFVTLWLFA